MEEAKLYKLTPLRPPVSILEPGIYLYRHRADRVEVELLEPLQSSEVARLIHRIADAEGAAA